MSRGGARFGHRIHENGRTIHELVADILSVHVYAEIHHQRPHRRVTLRRRLPRQRINVRKKTIAKIVVLHQNLLGFRAVRPKFIFVGIKARAVDTENRRERTELKPPDEQFAEARVARAGNEEAANVGRPIRQP